MMRRIGVFFDLDGDVMGTKHFKRNEQEMSIIAPPPQLPRKPGLSCYC